MTTLRDRLLAATKGATTLQACYDIAADAVAREMGRRREEEGQAVRRLGKKRTARRSTTATVKGGVR